MKKIFLSFLIMTLPLMTWADKNGTSGNCQWTFSTSGSKLTINGEGTMADYYFMNYAPWDSYASSILALEVKEGVTNIGSYTCRNCTNLTSVKIANSVNTIGRLAFYNCSKLNSVTIPEGVSNIDFRAFGNCGSLTKVYLPSSLKSMNDDVFGNSHLTTVYCSAKTVPTIVDESIGNFNAISENATLYVPASAIEDYRSTAPWNKFANILAMPKCANPTITFEDGKLKFNCDTEGVTFFSQIGVADAGDYHLSEIDLNLTYKVSVYATAEGYENSDVVTTTFQLNNNGIRGDVNQDGIVNVTDAVEVVNIILGNP